MFGTDPFRVLQPPAMPGPHQERHLTPNQIAELWGMHPATVRRLFRDEPGVIRLGAAGRRRKKDYFSLYIPESVMRRVHLRLTTRG